MEGRDWAMISIVLKAVRPLDILSLIEKVTLTSHEIPKQGRVEHSGHSLCTRACVTSAFLLRGLCSYAYALPVFAQSINLNM